MASKLQGTIEFLKDFGLFDVILPFLLIFAIVFSILEKTSLLGKKKQNLNSIVAIVCALFVVATNKVVAAISTAIPNIILLLVVIVSFLLLIGIFFKEGELDFSSRENKWYKSFVALIFMGVVIIFLGAWPMDSGISVFSYLFGYLYDHLGSDLVGGIILLVVISLIVRYVTNTKEGSDE